MSRGWRRLVVISCTLLLVGSIFMVLGMTVWAQEQQPPTEQPTEEPVTTEQPTTTEQPVTTEQPAQPETTQAEGLTIDYWEPQLGTRTVYYRDDLNDIHGNLYGTSTLGYVDVLALWLSRPWIVIFRVPDSINYTSSYYYNVEAISNMNPVYFGFQGPWYFNMTTPFKHIEEVKGIHEAPDAAEFPQATYAVDYLTIGSGGRRVWGTSYRSNDPTQQQWLEWGYTMEYFYPGNTNSSKYIYRYLSPNGQKMPVPRVILTFPLSVGGTSPIDAVYVEGHFANAISGSGSYEVIAEGEITLPGGTFDALLLKGDLTSSPNGERYTMMEYAWVVQDVGIVVDAEGLPNELGPVIGEATEILVMEEQTAGNAAPQ